nr:hypothetical protein [Tanacetum cinerariifolium]
GAGGRGLLGHLLGAGRRGLPQELRAERQLAAHAGHHHRSGLAHQCVQLLRSHAWAATTHAAHFVFTYYLPGVFAARTGSSAGGVAGG